MASAELANVEADPRFPSGPWTGFFVQSWLPGRHTMMLDMMFKDGALTAKGSDRVGPFTFTGSYDQADGRCDWTKQYLDKHQVRYAGVNEGEGIWGVWQIRLFHGLYLDRGVFHIWPLGMTPSEEADRTVRALPVSRVRARFELGMWALLAVILIHLLHLTHFWTWFK
jgi:hypothetical protein